MKKIVLLAFLLISSVSINAQNFNYGIALGGFYHDLEKKEGTLTPTANYSIIDFGFFGEYQLSSNSGILGKLNYSAKVVDEGYLEEVSQFIYVRSDEINFNAFNLALHYKFDTNNNYGKGFYVLAGPRISFITNAKSNKEEIKDFYKPVRFAGQIGFGVNFLKHFATELLFDYGFSNPLDSEENKVQTAGVNFNFTINLESILN